MDHTSAFSASKTAPGTASGQNSSGVKLHSIRLTNGRLILGHTCVNTQKGTLLGSNIAIILGAKVY